MNEWKSAVKFFQTAVPKHRSSAALLWIWADRISFMGECSSTVGRLLTIVGRRDALDLRNTGLARLCANAFPWANWELVLRLLSFLLTLLLMWVWWAHFSYTLRAQDVCGAKVSQAACFGLKWSVHCATRWRAQCADTGIDGQNEMIKWFHWPKFSSVSLAGNVWKNWEKSYSVLRCSQQQSLDDVAETHRLLYGYTDCHWSCWCHVLDHKCPSLIQSLPIAVRHQPIQRMCFKFIIRRTDV